ncbi:MAG: 1-acyl-sn-glycerol-3-phosphate acyltransferase [Proteobacteria bacterium]|nr:1-acyl-sn-glycerol-3-phosphate acyltransferase [Pseudomonadota bacterium]
MPRVRSLLFPVVLVAVTLAVGVAATVGGYADPRRRWVRHLASLWSRVVLWTAGVSVTVDGGEHLSPGAAPIFVANHQSNLDIPVLSLLLPREVLWLAKRELFAIPVFGQAIRAVGYLPVDRGNADAARASLDVAAQEVRRGFPVILFPEGTRSRDARLLPFKLGFLHLAEQSGAPVVPVVIRGTAALWPKGRVAACAGRVTVPVLPPRRFTPTEDGDERRARAAAVREAMARVLETR